MVAAKMSRVQFQGSNRWMKRIPKHNYLHLLILSSSELDNSQHTLKIGLLQPNFDHLKCMH